MRHPYNCHIVKPINGGAPFAFVRSRYGRGTWLRTDVCVPMVACAVCGAERGKVCLGRSGMETTSTHVDRKVLATRNRVREEFERAASITIDLRKFLSVKPRKEPTWPRTKP